MFSRECQVGAVRLFEIKFPETKLRVLQLIQENQKMEARELAEVLGIGVVHASKLLRDYYLRGLLKRRGSSMSHGGRRYSYYLSRAGEKKLKFLKTSKSSRSIPP